MGFCPIAFIQPVRAHTNKEGFIGLLIRPPPEFAALDVTRDSLFH